jgi:hypothetical protein
MDNISDVVWYTGLIWLKSVCCCHSVLWHMDSHCIIIFIISNIIYLLHLTLRKSKMTLFLGITMPACFLLGPSFLPRAVFQLSLKHLWPPLTRSSLPHGHHESHLIWVDSSLMAPLKLASIWVPLIASHEVQPPVWLSRGLSDLRGLRPGSPWLAAKSPWESF